MLHERKLPSTVISKMQFRSTVIKLLRKCGLKVKKLCWITSLVDHKNRLILKKKAVHIIGIMVRGTRPPWTESSRYSGNDCMDVEPHQSQLVESHPSCITFRAKVVGSNYHRHLLFQNQAWGSQINSLCHTTVLKSRKFISASKLSVSSVGLHRGSLCWSQRREKA